MFDILVEIFEIITSTPEGVITAQLFSAIGGILGGLAGAQGDRSRQTAGIRLGREGAQERQAREIATEQLGEISGLVGAGPGAEDVTQALGTQRGLARELEALRTTGLRPEEADIAAARAQLAPQRTAIGQAFEQEQLRANQLAAQLNRPVNDPIIQARLAQERIRAEERLGAQESAQAVAARGQRLGFGEALANLRGGLATQALQNRLTLQQLGSQVQEAGRQFRAQTGTRVSTGQQGGGLGGAITGALGGLGAGAGVASRFGGDIGFGQVGQFLGGLFGPTGATVESTAQGIGGGTGSGLAQGAAPGIARFRNF